LARDRRFAQEAMGDLVRICPAHREEIEMTGKADFSPEEWEVVLKGPPSAGTIVITAQRGGTFRETFSMAKA
jgi:hypothetical protein